MFHLPSSQSMMQAEHARLHTHSHTQTDTDTHKRAHTHTLTCTCTHLKRSNTRAHTHTSVHTRTSVNTHTNKHTHHTRQAYIHAHARTHTRSYKLAYKCMHTHLHTCTLIIRTFVRARVHLCVPYAQRPLVQLSNRQNSCNPMPLPTLPLILTVRVLQEHKHIISDTNYTSVYTLHKTYTHSITAYSIHSLANIPSHVHTTE